MRLGLIVEYEGTGYHGFQYQVNAPSIQEELEKAIASFAGERVRVQGAGRTDAGVHARGQVVAFDTASSHPPETFVRALNYYLPDAIAVKAAYGVPEGFDPRRKALTRRYRYTIVNGATPSPLLTRTACHVEKPLDVESMREAAKCLVGRHDFGRFAGPLEDEASSTIRHLYEATVSRDGEVLTLDFEGSSFLSHQVRRMAGSLVDIGKTSLSLEEFRLMVDGDRMSAVARSMPPQGLCLMEVTYAGFPPKVGEEDDDEY